MKLALHRLIGPGAGAAGKWSLSALAPALAVALVLALQALGAWRPLERFWFDHAATSGSRFALRDVALVAIDDDSAARLGPWPWPAERIAGIVERLGVAGARSVVLVGELPPPAPDDVLARAIARQGRTLLAQEGEGDALRAPRPAHAAGAIGVGHLDWRPDSDGVVRRIVMVPRGDGFSAPSLALLAAARQGTAGPGGSRGPRAAASSASAPSVEGGRLSIGGHTLSLDPDGALQPRWPAAGLVPAGARESAHALLAGAGSAARYAGKVVVVGATLPGAPALDTPARAAVPQAEALAQVVSALIGGQVLETPMALRVLSVLAALAAAAGVPWLAQRFTRASAWLWVAVVALVSVVASNLLAQATTLWWPGVVPALAWLAAQAARHGMDRRQAPTAASARRGAAGVPAWAQTQVVDTVPSDLADAPASRPSASRPAQSRLPHADPPHSDPPHSEPPHSDPPHSGSPADASVPAHEEGSTAPDARAPRPGPEADADPEPPPPPPGMPAFEPTVVMAPPSATPMFGAYPLVREAARGSLGSVYLAHDPVHGYPVALKTMALTRFYEGAALAQARRDLADQVGAAASLRHPDIVSTLGAGEVDGLDFVLSEWVDGDDLARLLRQGAVQSSVTGLLRTMARLSKAVAYAHRQGLMHGAIRPSQVLVDPAAHRVTLQGFGTAYTVRDIALRQGAGQILLFAAPELLGPSASARTQRRDPRTDIFGLAAVLYFALTGQPPRTDTGGRHAPDLRALRADLPGSLAALLAAALSPQPQARPRDGLAFAEGLQAAFEELGGQVSRPAPLRDVK